jgi:hypothetical protein
MPTRMIVVAMLSEMVMIKFHEIEYGRNDGQTDQDDDHIRIIIRNDRAERNDTSVTMWARCVSRLAADCPRHRRPPPSPSVLTHHSRRANCLQYQHQQQQHQQLQQPGQQYQPELQHQQQLHNAHVQVAVAAAAATETASTTASAYARVTLHVVHTESINGTCTISININGNASCLFTLSCHTYIKRVRHINSHLYIARVATSSATSAANVSIVCVFSGSAHDIAKRTLHVDINFSSTSLSNSITTSASSPATPAQPATAKQSHHPPNHQQQQQRLPVHVLLQVQVDRNAMPNSILQMHLDQEPQLRHPNRRPPQQPY